MRRAYLWRYSASPSCIQDFDTYILLGRHGVTQYNTHTRRWYVVTGRPDKPKRLCDETHQRMASISRQLWLARVPKWRGRLAIAEDLIGFRLFSRVWDWWTQRGQEPASGSWRTRPIEGYAPEEFVD